MKKFLKWFLIIVAVLGIGLYATFKWAQSNTKKHSPEQVVTYTEGGLSLEVFYNRPSKKNRVIFGELVPYEEIWRTGANEATTFTTNQALSIKGKTLPAGKYSIWTLPGAEEWTIYFNDKMYPWGVGFDGQASREAEFDVLQINQRVKNISRTVEQFTISFVEDSPEVILRMEWENTRVDLPLQPTGV